MAVLPHGYMAEWLHDWLLGVQQCAWANQLCTYGFSGYGVVRSRLSITALSRGFRGCRCGAAALINCFKHHWPPDRGLAPGWSTNNKGYYYYHVTAGCHQVIHLSSHLAQFSEGRRRKIDG